MGAGPVGNAGRPVFRRYEFDPRATRARRDLPKLGIQPKTVWKAAWKRYAAAATRYPGLEATAMKGKPPSEGIVICSRWKSSGGYLDNKAEESRTAKGAL